MSKSILNCEKHLVSKCMCDDCQLARVDENSEFGKALANANKYGVGEMKDGKCVNPLDIKPSTPAPELELGWTKWSVGDQQPDGGVMVKVKLANSTEMKGPTYSNVVFILINQ